MLKPTSKWCWFIDPDSQMLSIDLDDMLFTTAYHQRQLLPSAAVRQEFSIEDHGFYSRLGDNLGLLPHQLTDARATQTALNATAIKKFYRPMMPKSWYFSKHDYCGQHHGFSVLENHHGQGQVVIIDKDKISSLCMLMSAGMQLDDKNRLSQFAAIKVMNEYLLPYLTDSSLA
ncbi:cell division protein ZapC [Alteromonadaceae bacterium BrNp21-10]|nr:cell division protein ZapC [Alteromonadaceae bacterium BrNp21-10]